MKLFFTFLFKQMFQILNTLKHEEVTYQSLNYSIFCVPPNTSLVDIMIINKAVLIKDTFNNKIMQIVKKN